MGIEPYAATRLRLVQTTTPDPVLRAELAAVLGDAAPAVEPSPALVRAIDACRDCRADARSSGGEGLCAAHRGEWLEQRWRAEEGWAPIGADLADVVRGVLGSGCAGAELVAAVRAQAQALRLVAEAHARGAVRLPDALARAVREAQRLTPSFLRGAK